MVLCVSIILKGVVSRNLSLLSLAVLVVNQADAHHSFAMFDAKTVTVLRGTVVSFSYLNPHSWISVLGTVGDAESSVRWDIQATAPFSLARIGISPDTLKPGDKITVAFHPLRDGRHGGSLFIGDSDGACTAPPADVGLTQAVWRRGCSGNFFSAIFQT
jgi:hypothetical protein